MCLVQLTFDIPQAASPQWDMVRQIRDEVFVLLADQPLALRECAAMAASELTENALKYGFALDEAALARVEVVVTDSEITIAAKNGIREPEAAGQIKDVIEALAAGASPEELYMQRLTELVSEPSLDESESRLGLLRIAHEGEFRLECECTGNVLLVRATRKLLHG